MEDSKKVGYVIAVIGAMGEGKSLFIKDLINVKRNGEQPNCLVYDFQQDDYPELSTDYKKERRARFLGIPSDFEKEAYLRKRSIVVFEEGTAFIGRTLKKEMESFLISKRHDRNVIVFVFHSIQETTREILRLCDFVVLHKTGDIEKDVKDRAPWLLPAFQDLQKKPSTKYPNITRVLIDRKKAMTLKQ